MNTAEDFIEQDKPQPETIKVIPIDYSTYEVDDLINDDLYYYLCLIEDGNKHRVEYTKAGYRAAELKCKRLFDKGYKEYLKKLAKEQIADGTAGNKTNFWGQPFILRCGSWDCDDTGVSHIKQDSEGNCTKEIASPIPIMVTEVLTNISNVNKIIDLSNFGIEVTSESAKFLVKYLSELINLNRDLIPQAKATARMGWIDDKTFIPYADNIKYDGEKNKDLYNSITAAGSFDIWQNKTQELRESLILRLLMGASFASPIIGLLETLPFICHLWGASDTRKTVSLKIAASIWGNPQPGKLVISLNNTQNFLLTTAAFLNNIPIFGDEMQTIKTTNWDNYDKLIMTFTQGVNRGRNHGDDSIPLLSWLNCLITTGEERIIKENSGGGAVNRVIELSCDKNIIEDGTGAIECINENYGAAGKKFITALINTDKTELKRIYNEFYKAIINLHYTTDKQAASMAIILTGDSIASRLLYPGEKPLTVADIKDFLISAAEVDKSERAYTYIVNHIASNVNKFDKFNDLGKKVTDDTNINHGEIWGYIQGRTASVNKNVLIRELSASEYEFDAFKKTWADKNYIIECPSTAGRKKRYYHRETHDSIPGDYIKVRLTAELIDEFSKEDVTFTDLPL